MMITLEQSQQGAESLRNWLQEGLIALTNEDWHVEIYHCDKWTHQFLVRLDGASVLTCAIAWSEPGLDLTKWLSPIAVALSMQRMGYDVTHLMKRPDIQQWIKEHA